MLKDVQEYTQANELIVTVELKFNKTTKTENGMLFGDDLQAWTQRSLDVVI